ncbi:MAG: hypothetical protein K8T91_09135 [Planctomycetes bacterium]|nr:hypothetical protein [Planctomycetota bacterium]
MFLKKRRRHFIDRGVQGALMLRAALYWGCCLLIVTLVLLVWQTVTGPARIFYLQFDGLWFRYGPALVIALCLLPLVLVDVVRMSNRFAGPAYRLRRAMHQLAKGEKVHPITFRQGDFWKEFADDFNRIAARMEKAEQSKAGLCCSADAESDPVSVG